MLSALNTKILSFGTLQNVLCVYHCYFNFTVFSRVLSLQVLVSALSEEQLDRYEAFRRSKFPQSMMRKTVHGMTGVMPSSNCCIALSGPCTFPSSAAVSSVLKFHSSLRDRL